MLTSDAENWILYMRVSGEDRPLTKPIGFTKDNQQIYWKMGQNSDLGELSVHNYDTPNRGQLIYKANRTEIFDVTLHPIEHTPLLVTEYFHKPEIHIISQTIADDMQYLIGLRPHATLSIESTSNNFNLWLLKYDSDERPFEYFLYDRSIKHAEYLDT